jgi:hypothetical protein
MARGKKPDPRKRKTAHPHSTHFKVLNKQRRGAWCAGEVFGCYTHRTHASSPCLDDLTEGALSCPYCKAGVECSWRGYLPVWDEDFQLCHALFGESMFEVLDMIPFRHPLTISRAAPVRSPLLIRAEPMLSRQLPDRSPWSEPVDILPILLTLWKCDELTVWYTRNPPAASAKPTPVKSDGKPFSPMTAAAAKKYTPPESPSAAAEEDYDAVRNRLKQVARKLPASSNGHHSKPE